MTLPPIPEKVRSLLAPEALAKLEATKAELEAANSLWHTVASDYHQAVDDWRSDSPNQYRRRTVVRTWQAMIEYTIRRLQSHLLMDHRSGRIQLKPHEILLLRERVYSVDKSGKAYHRRDSQNLRSMIRFVQDLFASMYSVPKIDVNEEGSRWSEVCQAIAIRNRLTHPSTLEGYEVSDDEMALVERAAGWFVTEFGRLTRQVGEAERKRIVSHYLKERVELALRQAKENERSGAQAGEQAASE